MVEHAVPELRAGGDGFSVEDWLSWDGPGDFQVELIDGTLVVNPAPALRHQRAAHRLIRALAGPLDAAGLTADMSGSGVVSPGMDPEQALIPDIVVADAHLDIDDLVVLQAADVVLAVEVLSPSSRRRDRSTKLEIYAGMGIPHYWIVDPTAPVTIATHVLEGGGYRQDGSAAGDEPLVVREPCEVTLVPASLATKPGA